MISDVINADLVVADLTDLNPNAFYELGIRHSTEKPTIHIARLGTVLPFDTITHRTIFVGLTDWHSIEQGRARLAESARAIKLPDYKVSNPITQANASFKMRQSEDPRDRFLAGIEERLERLEGKSSRKPAGGLDILNDLADQAESFFAAGMSPNDIRAAILKTAKSNGMSINQVKVGPSGLSRDCELLIKSGDLSLTRKIGELSRFIPESPQRP